MAAGTGKPSKRELLHALDNLLKTEHLFIRLAPQQLQVLRRAAERSGLGLSSWVRAILVDRALDIYDLDE